MIPGILIGIEAQSVDYDAVAYRTGVILCEDPGSPSYPDEAWEVKEYYRKDEVDRFGLAVSRDSPGILLPDKIERFFNGTFFEEQDIQNRMLFSNQPFGPYAYNVTLSLDDGVGTVYRLDSNAPIPEDPYGYIRRAVKVKGEHYMAVDLSDPTTQGDLTETAISSNVTRGYLPININLTALQREEIPRIYQINPYQDKIKVNITNFGSTVVTPLFNVSLIEVSIYKGYGNSLTKVAGSFSSFEDERYLFYIGGNPKTLSVTGGEVMKTTDPTELNDIGLVLKPAMFSYLEPLPGDTIQVNLSFQYYFDAVPPCTYILNGGETTNEWTDGVYYEYTSEYVTQEEFTAGELEVVIW